MNQNDVPRQTNKGVLVCVVCGRRVLPDETEHPPFCSQRCKMIDLGRWLNEEVGLPHEGGPTKGEAVQENEGQP